MKNKASFFMIPVLILLLLAGCATLAGGGEEQEEVLPAHEKITAVKFPELWLQARGETTRVKLLTLEEWRLTALPHPYWQTEPFSLPLEEVHSLKVQNESRPGLFLGLGSASGTFAIVGLVGGSQADSDEDWKRVTPLALLSGLLTGGVALYQSQDIKEAMEPEYLLTFMKPERKLEILKELMGVEGKKRRPIRGRRYFSPLEAEEISAQRKVHVLPADGRELVLRRCTLENSRLAGYAKGGAREEIPFRDITALYVHKVNPGIYPTAALAAGAVATGIWLSAESPR
jgi:hypothetical protein